MNIKTLTLEKNSIIPLNFDYVFTSIFNNEKNINILENFLSVYLEVPIEKVKGKVKLQARELPIENKKVKRKQVYLIIDLEGEKINIELSNQMNQGIIDRNIVYLCSIHSRELKYGDNRYQNIKKTLQINLNNFKCNKEKIKESYYIQNEKGEKLSEKIQIDVIDMEKAKEKCYTTSENKLARWCQLMTVNKLEELKEIVGDDLMEEEAREQLIEEVEGISSDDEVIALYSAYTQDELERNSIMYEETEKAREKGLREGREKGLEEGIKEGIKEGIEQGIEQEIEHEKIAIAKRLIEMGMNLNDINKITELSIEQINKIDYQINNK